MKAPSDRSARHRDVALPTSALVALRHALRREAGPLAAVHALQAAGFEAGQDLYEAFDGTVDRAPEELGAKPFWAGLTDFFRSRGWGTLRHESAHPGIGALRTSDWAEAEDEGEESQPSCTFTSGMLAGFLSRVAGHDVAVLQVSCRSQGDADCVFAFGSEATIRDLYGLLLDGSDFASALDQL